MIFSPIVEVLPEHASSRDIGLLHIKFDELAVESWFGSRGINGVAVIEADADGFGGMFREQATLGRRSFAFIDLQRDHSLGVHRGADVGATIADADLHLVQFFIGSTN